MITVLSESIRKKTLILKFLRIPYTHGVFRHFSTSLRRVPRRWRGPAADGATPGGRSVSPKVLEQVHFGAKHRRRNQYFIVHILVHFFRHSKGLRFVGTQIWLSCCTLRTYPQICSILKEVVVLNGMKMFTPPLIVLLSTNKNGVFRWRFFKSIS